VNESGEGLWWDEGDKSLRVVWVTLSTSEYLWALHFFEASHFLQVATLSWTLLRVPTLKFENKWELSHKWYKSRLLSEHSWSGCTAGATDHEEHLFTFLVSQSGFCVWVRNHRGEVQRFSGWWATNDTRHPDHHFPLDQRSYLILGGRTVSVPETGIAQFTQDIESNLTLKTLINQTFIWFRPSLDSEKTLILPLIWHWLRADLTARTIYFILFQKRKKGPVCYFLVPKRGASFHPTSSSLYVSVIVWLCVQSSVSTPIFCR